MLLDIEERRARRRQCELLDLQFQARECEKAIHEQALRKAAEQARINGEINSEKE